MRMGTWSGSGFPFFHPFPVSYYLIIVTHKKETKLEKITGNFKHTYKLFYLVLIVFHEFHHIMKVFQINKISYHKVFHFNKHLSLMIIKINAGKARRVGQMWSGIISQIRRARLFFHQQMWNRECFIFCSSLYRV